MRGRSPITSLGFYEFTGFIKCGCCRANYRCQSGKRKDGTPTRSWYCTGPKDQCHNPGIRDETMKRLVADVLALDEFDEAAMDAQIENATILDHTVTFHFRDGHTESRDFLDKRRGTPWTEERREKARESMKTDFVTVPGFSSKYPLQYGQKNRNRGDFCKS